MQKINVLMILSGHVDSMRSDNGKLLRSDFLVFFVLPIVLGLSLYLAGWKIPKDAFELSITVFSVFAALLLSVQVALYSVSLRPLLPPDDQKKKKAFEEIKASRNIVIRELNSNISYLILLSVILVTLLLCIVVFSYYGSITSAVIFSLYVHFFFTLLMVVKRSSIIFSREYEVSGANGMSQA